MSDRNYHLLRAKVERDVAYSAANTRAFDAHIRLSALHLIRASVFEEVDAKLGPKD